MNLHTTYTYIGGIRTMIRDQLKHSIMFFSIFLFFFGGKDSRWNSFYHLKLASVQRKPILVFQLWHLDNLLVVTWVGTASQKERTILDWMLLVRINQCKISRSWPFLIDCCNHNQLTDTHCQSCHNDKFGFLLVFTSKTYMPSM